MTLEEVKTILDQHGFICYSKHNVYPVGELTDWCFTYPDNLLVPKKRNGIPNTYIQISMTNHRITFYHDLFDGEKDVYLLKNLKKEELLQNVGELLNAHNKRKIEQQKEAITEVDV